MDTGSRPEQAPIITMPAPPWALGLSRIQRPEGPEGSRDTSEGCPCLPSVSLRSPSCTHGDTSRLPPAGPETTLRAPQLLAAEARGRMDTGVSAWSQGHPCQPTRPGAGTAALTQGSRGCRQCQGECHAGGRRACLCCVCTHMHVSVSLHDECNQLHAGVPG